MLLPRLLRVRRCLSSHLDLSTRFFAVSTVFSGAGQKRSREGSVNTNPKPQQKSQYAGPASGQGLNSTSARAARQSSSQQEGHEQQYAALAASVADAHFLKGPMVSVLSADPTCE